MPNDTKHSPERIPTPFHDGTLCHDLSGKVIPVVLVSDYEKLAERCKKAEVAAPETAAELERVKAENEELIQEIAKCHNCKEFKALEAERDKLKAVNKELVEALKTVDKAFGHKFNEELIDLIEAAIAKAAL